jgi:hypothetical protein
MTIPKTVKVGGLRYKVLLKDEIEICGEMKLGSFDNEKLTIEISSGCVEDARLVTLWHEIIHAIDEQANLQMTEGATNALAHSVVQILRDNPALKQ